MRVVSSKWSQIFLIFWIFLVFLIHYFWVQLLYSFISFKNHLLINIQLLITRFRTKLTAIFAINLVHHQNLILLLGVLKNFDHINKFLFQPIICFNENCYIILRFLVLVAWIFIVCNKHSFVLSLVVLYARFAVVNFQRECTVSLLMVLFLASFSWYC